MLARSLVSGVLTIFSGACPRYDRIVAADIVLSAEGPAVLGGQAPPAAPTAIDQMTLSSDCRTTFRRNEKRCYGAAAQGIHPLVRIKPKARSAHIL